MQTELRIFEVDSKGVAREVKVTGEELFQNRMAAKPWAIKLAQAAASVSKNTGSD